MHLKLCDDDDDDSDDYPGDHVKTFLEIAVTCFVCFFFLCYDRPRGVFYFVRLNNFH